jgi:ATP synthase protein I
MSSRTENDDPWLAHVSRTADCGPRPVLPPGRVRGLAGMGLAGMGLAGMTVSQSGADRAPQPSDQAAKPAGPQPQQPDREQQSRPPRESDGWQILSYMLGGMLLYGTVGWLVSHWTGIAILFPVGMILGIGLSVAMIIFRFSRS